MAIKKIDEEVLYKIKEKSANALPDRPTAQGYTAKDIKRYLTGFVTDDELSIVAEINRVIDELNSFFDGEDENVEEQIKRLIEENRPSINDVPLNGNKTFEDLGLSALKWSDIENIMKENEEETENG